MENEIEKQKADYISDGIKKINDKARIETFIKLIEDVERPTMETVGGIVVLNTLLKQLKTSGENALENLDIVHKF